MPEEYFRDAPAIPVYTHAHQEVMQRTENPLLNAQKANVPVLKKESDVVKKTNAAGSKATQGFVPPPPPNGPKYPPPVGMPPAKLFPISVGVAPPANMSFPGMAPSDDGVPGADSSAGGIDG